MHLLLCAVAGWTLTQSMQRVDKKFEYVDSGFWIARGVCLGISVVMPALRLTCMVFKGKARYVDGLLYGLAGAGFVAGLSLPLYTAADGLCKLNTITLPEFIK